MSMTCIHTLPHVIIERKKSDPVAKNNSINGETARKINMLEG